MSAQRIILLKQTTQKPAPSPDTQLADLDTVKHWVKSRSLHHHLLHYGEAQGVTYHVDLLSKPLTFALLLRIFSRGRCFITDQFDHCVAVTPAYLLGLASTTVADRLHQPQLLRTIQQEITGILEPEQGPQHVKLDRARRPLYLRTDLVFGLQSGGSVGHIAGVLNHLDALAGQPLFLTTDQIPTVRPDIATVRIWPDGRFREFGDLRTLAFNARFYQEARRQLPEEPIALV